MDYLDLYRNWRDDAFFADFKKELQSLDETKDAKEIEDRFYRELEFGTAGLRGIMGAGTNRMNKFTVGKATAGFGAYLLKKYGKDACSKRGVVVCYDTRNNSRDFSLVTANVLSSLGIKVYFHENARPIPELSYSITKYGAVGGVMVTASHNPKEYNGYKVYDETGCQLTPADADEVINCVNKVSGYKQIDFSGNEKLIEKINITDEFVSVILKQSRLNDETAKKNLNIVYTPLHGTGYVPVCKALEADGFKNVHIVKSQAEPNGDFPTVVSPNPEDKRALELGIKLGEEVGADVVIGTDPDSDRVGAAVKTADGFKLITGNQMGALMIDFILSSGKLPEKPVIIKSIVTSNFGAKIAEKYGVKVLNTLTGFKFIGERMNQFLAAKQSKNSKIDYDYVFGYEESYGYLVGTHARDKDAVVSCMIIAEMAAKLKTEGKTIADRLAELYDEFGYFLDCQDSFTLNGKDGIEQIQNMMKDLRKTGYKLPETEKVLDFLNGIKAEEGFGTYPQADVLMYELGGGSWVAVRPSGTEPKIKIYYSIKGKNQAEAEEKQKNFQTLLKTQMGL